MAINICGKRTDVETLKKVFVVWCARLASARRGRPPRVPARSPRSVRLNDRTIALAELGLIVVSLGQFSAV
jgi:hypothetical protein